MSMQVNESRHALLIGSLVLLLTLRLRERRASVWTYMLWGGLVGLGFWAFGLSLVFTIPAAWATLRDLRRRPPAERRAALVASAGGFLIGASPWFYWAVVNGPRRLLSELLGSAIAGEGGSYALEVLGRLRNLALFGPTVAWGMRPPWSTQALAVPLLAFALLFWLIVLWDFLRRFGRPQEARPHSKLIAGVFLTLMAGFVVTPFGDDPSGRYFVPLVIPFALLGAESVVSSAKGRRSLAVRSLFVLTLVFNLWGTVQAAAADPPGITTQFDPVTRVDRRADEALIQFLNEKGERRGYKIGRASCRERV